MKRARGIMSGAPLPYDPTRRTKTAAWLDVAFDSCRRRNMHVDTLHVKAHTDARDEDSRLNHKADQLARLAVDSPQATTLPPLTAFMPRVAVWHPTTGYTRRWRDMLAADILQRTFVKTPPNLREKMRDDRRDAAAVVEPHLYVKSPAVVAPRVQLSTRTGQFVTESKASYISRTLQSPACRFCGFHKQDMAHLFRDCPHFDTDRRKWVDEYVAKAHRRYDHDTATSMRAYYQDTIDLVPFWFGHVPDPEPPLTATHMKDAHYFAVTLTAHIAGIQEKDRTERWLTTVGRRR